MLRASAVALGLAVLAGAPLVVAARTGLAPDALLAAGLAGLTTAVDAVGWVLIPQLLLAVAILSLALQQLTGRLAGVALPDAPPWLDPAVESALLLGLLGTISGMVQGFAGIAPDALQPGPLVHSLGTALRSSFVGFAIALVGVWVKAARPAAAREPVPAARGREVEVA